MKKKQIAPFLVAFFILLGAGFSIYYYKVLKTARKPTVAHYGEDFGSAIRPFKFVNQDGDTITEQNLKGKILIVEFFFTNCPSICPIMNEQMARVYESVRTNDDVLILSHTVDPDNDSVPALKAYSLKYNADPKRWMFLTGDKKALYEAAFLSYKVTAREDEEEPIEHAFIHAPNFVLVDKQGRLRASIGDNDIPEMYDGTNPASVDRLIQDIKELLNEQQ